MIHVAALAMLFATLGILEPAAGPPNAVNLVHGTTEATAAALPNDEDIAGALDGEIWRSTQDLPDDVHVTPDGLRAVVRNSRCEFLAGSRSRVDCTFEHQRSVLDATHSEAVTRVSHIRNWPLATRTLVHSFVMVGGERRSFWQLIPFMAETPQ